MEISPEVAEFCLRLIGLTTLSPAHPDFERDAALTIMAKRELTGTPSPVVELQTEPVEE